MSFPDTPAAISIVLIGGGGHCVSCIDVIESTGKYTIEGILDIPERLGQSVLGYPIIGTDAELPVLARKFTNFAITVGHLGNSSLRRHIHGQVKGCGGSLPAIVSRHAYVSRHAQLGEGTIVHPFALVNAEARIGACSIINSAALVEHGARVGDHCHISTSAVVNGDVTVWNDVFLGSGAVCKQGIEIPEGTFVKANTVFKGV